MHKSIKSSKGNNFRIRHFCLGAKGAEQSISTEKAKTRKVYKNFNVENADIALYGRLTFLEDIFSAAS